MSVQNPKTVEVAIGLQGDDPYVPPAEADPGDTILWHAGDDTVSIWFPDDDVFASREIVSRGSGDIEIQIPGTAAPGNYHYAVFNHDMKKFATGGSHPIMIIKGP